MDGVEGLYLKPISYADSDQRKGRAGRCKPGIYTDWCESTERLDFPKAEILRSRFDQTVLRLAEAGFNMEELEFFHQPDKKEIHEAKRALHALGCLTLEGKVTKIGHYVSQLPVSVHFGRMLVEAYRLGVVDDVLSIVAILEQGGITARPKGRFDFPRWKVLCRGEETSDPLAQLMIWERATRMNRKEMEEKGIFAKAYFQALEKRRHITQSLRGKIQTFKSSGNRDHILRAVLSGMVDHLYKNSWGAWKNGDDTERQLARESVVRSDDWIVGVPFDLSIKNRFGGQSTLNLVQMATKVDPTLLMEIAPYLIKVVHGIRPRYDSARDICVSLTCTFFNDQLVKEERVDDPDHVEAENLRLAYDDLQRVAEDRMKRPNRMFERPVRREEPVAPSGGFNTIGGAFDALDNPKD